MIFRKKICNIYISLESRLISNYLFIDKTGKNVFNLFHKQLNIYIIVVIVSLACTKYKTKGLINSLTIFYYIFLIKAVTYLKVFSLIIFDQYKNTHLKNHYYLFSINLAVNLNLASSSKTQIIKKITQNKIKEL